MKKMKLLCLGLTLCLAAGCGQKEVKNENIVASTENASEKNIMIINGTKVDFNTSASDFQKNVESIKGFAYVEQGEKEDESVYKTPSGEVIEFSQVTVSAPIEYKDTDNINISIKTGIPYSIYGDVSNETKDDQLEEKDGWLALASNQKTKIFENDEYVDWSSYREDFNKLKDNDFRIDTLDYDITETFKAFGNAKDCYTKYGEGAVIRALYNTKNAENEVKAPKTCIRIFTENYRTMTHDKTLAAQVFHGTDEAA